MGDDGGLKLNRRGSFLSFPSFHAFCHLLSLSFSLFPPLFLLPFKTRWHASRNAAPKYRTREMLATFPRFPLFCQRLRCRAFSRYYLNIGVTQSLQRRAKLESTSTHAEPFPPLKRLGNRTQVKHVQESDSVLAHESIGKEVLRALTI